MFIKAETYLRQIERQQPVRATISELAIHHVVSTAPDWARTKAMAGVLGACMGRAGGISNRQQKRARLAALKQRQELMCITS